MNLKKINILLIITLLIISCKNDFIKKDISKSDFVYLKAKKFKINEKDFFPIMLNYVVCFRNIDSELLISPIREYENPYIFESNSKDSIEYQTRAHLQLIKEMGFNSIRLVFDRVYSKEDKYYYHTDNQDFYIAKDYTKILDGLQNYLKIVQEFDLKVMLLIKAPIENNDLKEFTIRLLDKFKDNPTIFAYDFFNEPLYFDQVQLPPDKQKRKKEDAYEIVREWKEMMTNHAPNQLFTIGFSEPIEVFEWDPEILAVDFVSFHTYNPLRVPNEIYWYSKYINKPWMIGETALPADGDSISYEEQRQFMKEVYKRVVDCGGSGMGWWEFQEIPDTHFEAQYTGILNNKGITTTKDGKYKIIGTVKPVINEIAQFKEYKAKPAHRMPNYYNMLGYKNIVLKGRIIDKKTGNPIEGAVIRGWNQSWSIGMNTFSDSKGFFNLYSNDECVHFEISAPGKTKVKFNYKTNYYPIKKTDIKFDSLTDRNIEYHSISYKSFLNKQISTNTNISESNIFNFDKSKFGNALYWGFLTNIQLDDLDFNWKK